jgi:hypothetical protein
MFVNRSRFRDLIFLSKNQSDNECLEFGGFAEVFHHFFTRVPAVKKTSQLLTGGKKYANAMANVDLLSE